MLLINILLALVWVALSANMSVPNFVLGFALGYLVLFPLRYALGAPRYSVKVYRSITFAVYFLAELTLASLRVAWDVITPRHHMQPAIIAVPLDARTDLEITSLANLVTLTPGTLTLDISDDRRTMYVHGMYVTEPERFRLSIKRGFERRLLEILR